MPREGLYIESGGTSAIVNIDRDLSEHFCKYHEKHPDTDLSPDDLYWSFLSQYFSTDKGVNLSARVKVIAQSPSSRTRLFRGKTIDKASEADISFQMAEEVAKSIIMGTTPRSEVEAVERTKTAAINTAFRDVLAFIADGEREYHKSSILECCRLAGDAALRRKIGGGSLLDTYLAAFERRPDKIDFEFVSFLAGIGISLHRDAGEYKPYFYRMVGVISESRELCALLIPQFKEKLGVDIIDTGSLYANAFRAISNLSTDHNTADAKVAIQKLYTAVGPEGMQKTIRGHTLLSAYFSALSDEPDRLDPEIILMLNRLGTPLGFHSTSLPGYLRVLKGRIEGSPELFHIFSNSFEQIGMKLDKPIQLRAHERREVGMRRLQRARSERREAPATPRITHGSSRAAAASAASSTTYTRLVRLESSPRPQGRGLKLPGHKRKPHSLPRLSACM